MTLITETKINVNPSRSFFFLPRSLSASPHRARLRRLPTVFTKRPTPKTPRRKEGRKEKTKKKNIIPPPFTFIINTNLYHIIFCCSIIFFVLLLLQKKKRKFEDVDDDNDNDCFGASTFRMMMRMMMMGKRSPKTAAAAAAAGGGGGGGAALLASSKRNRKRKSALTTLGGSHLFVSHSSSSSSSSQNLSSNNGEEEGNKRYEHERGNADTRPLKKWLEERGIDARETFSNAPSSSSSSSNGGLKSIDDLLKEIENGETVLEENNTEDTPGGDVSCVRRVSVVVVEITSKSKPNKKLIEYVQTLPSGATRKRERFLSEKIMTGKGEGPLEAAERGIREELGAALSPTATIRIDKNSLLVKEEFATSSLSYRRLPTRYRFYEVKAEIEGLPVDEDTFASEETCGTKAVWKWV